MPERDWKRLRGLHQLLHDAVRDVARFVEKHHREAAAKPFELLEAVPPAETPTRVVRTVHDGVLTTVYGSIQAVNAVTQQVGVWVVDRLEAAEASRTPSDVDARDDGAQGDDHPDADPLDDDA